MKAIVLEKYGPPDVLQLEEVEKPAPKNDEVLVRIQATTVTPPDCAFRSGEPFVARFFSGLMRPKLKPGWDLAGAIEHVGKDVELFKEGDQVFGSAGPDFGAHAEYTCLPEDGALATKPANTTYEEAVAVCDGALTALPFLRDTANIQSGQRILINGTSGSVGAAEVHVGFDPDTAPIEGQLETSVRLLIERMLNKRS